MHREKKERNKEILQLLKSGKTYTEVMSIFGLKSKGNIYQIVKRDRERKAEIKLST